MERPVIFDGLEATRDVQNGTGFRQGIHGQEGPPTEPRHYYPMVLVAPPQGAVQRRKSTPMLELIDEAMYTTMSDTKVAVELVIEKTPVTNQACEGSSRYL